MTPSARIRGVTGMASKIGQGVCRLVLDGGVFLKATTHLLPNLPVDLLLRMKELYQNKFKIDFRKREVTAKGDRPVQLLELKDVQALRSNLAMETELRPSNLVLLSEEPVVDRPMTEREQNLWNILQENIHAGHSPKFYDDLRKLVMEFSHVRS